MIVLMFEGFNTQIVINEEDDKQRATAVKCLLIPASFYLELPHGLLNEKLSDYYYDDHWCNFLDKSKSTGLDLSGLKEKFRSVTPKKKSAEMKWCSYLDLMKILPIIYSPTIITAEGGIGSIVKNPGFLTVKEKIPAGKTWIGVGKTGKQNKPDVLYITQRPEDAEAVFKASREQNSMGMAAYKSWYWYYTDDWISVIFYIFSQVLAPNEGLDNFQFLNPKGVPIEPYGKELFVNIKYGLPTTFLAKEEIVRSIAQYAMKTSMQQNLIFTIPKMPKVKDEEEEQDEEEENEAEEHNILKEQKTTLGFAPSLTPGTAPYFFLVDRGSDLYRTCMTNNYQFFKNVLDKCSSVADTLAEALDILEDEIKPKRRELIRQHLKKFMKQYLDENPVHKQDESIKGFCVDLQIDINSSAREKSPDPNPP